MSADAWTGTATGDVAGRCHRDAHGVPTLVAASLPELAYLQGWHVATERAWQVDCEHRRVTGMGAEVFGPPAVANDVAARQMDLDGAARRAFDALDDAEDRAWFTRFADGVNAGLDAGARRAPEFAAHGVKPLPFDPHTALALHLGYNVWLTNAPAALFRTLLAERFPALAAALISPRPDADGSNAWAVRVGAEGAPLVAADPHRLLELPGVYQQVRLVVEAERPRDRVDVVGLAFPGVPGVPHVGQSEHVAWVTTSAMVSSLEMVLEDAPEGPEVLDARTERVHVRGGDPVDVRVAHTPRGRLVDVPGAGPVSMRFPAWDRADTGLPSARRLLTAASAAEACAVLDGHVEPVNRVIVADRRTVLTRHAGAVRRRDRRSAWGAARASALGRGSADGSLDQRWVRWPAPAAADDVVVAANEPHPDTACLTVDACAPWRSRRIREALEALAPQERTVDAMAALQTDTRTPGAPRAWLADAVDALVADGVLAAESVPAWAGDAAAGSAAARWWLLVEHEVAAALIAHLPPASRALLGGPWAPWGDAAAWVGAALAERGPEPLRAALGITASTRDLVRAAVAAVDDAAEPPGPDGAARTWGEAHALTPFLFTHEHPGGPDVPGLADVLDTIGSVRVGGTADAVCATSHAPGLAVGTHRGPVARVVFDLGDRTRSRWVVPFGASGLGGGHVTDQLDAWAAGRLLPVPSRPVPPSAGSGVAPARSVPGGAPPGRIVAEVGVGALGLTMTRVRPALDAPLIHALVTEPRAEFYGMRGHSVQDVEEVYDFLEFQPTHANHLVWHGGTLVALVQTYDPRAEEVGGAYEVRDGDLGFHFINAPGGLQGRARATAYRSIVDWLGARPGTRRLVIEPDVRNTRAVKTARALGFTVDREVELPGKRAALYFRDAR